MKLLIGVIAGPGLLAFLSEYATYYYALNENIRPPLEGIPYLSASVALASLFLSITAICIFLFTRWVLDKFVIHPVVFIRETFLILGEKVNITTQPDKVIEKGINTLQDLKAKSAIPIIITLAIGLALLVWAIQYLAAKISGGILFSFTEFKYLAIYFFIILLTLWRPVVNSVIAILSVILFYLFSLSVLFDTDYYSNYLNIIKYGGNIPVLLQYKDTLTTESYILVLRSKEYVFVRDAPEGLALELPLDNVRSLAYE